jgi:hypothetical protein
MPVVGSKQRKEFETERRRLPFAGHLQKSLAKHPIINAVGKSHHAIARVVVLFLSGIEILMLAPLHAVPKSS